MRRGDKYCVRVYVGKRQEWVGTFRTQREARQAELDALTRVRPAQEETVKSFGDRWLAAPHRWRASTRRHNGYMLAPLLADKDLAPLLLSDVSRKVAFGWAVKNRASVPVVRAMFNAALNEECIRRNPFSNLKLEQPRGRRDLVALREPEVVELSDAALSLFGPYGPAFRANVLFAAYVGLRPAEMFVLQWSDIDRLRSRVHIARSLGSTGVIERPKNDHVRSVVLPPQAVEALGSVPRHVSSPYIFATPTGKRFSKTSHYYYWRALRLHAGRPEMAFYELRHFCATYLLENGVSHADVAFQLGHLEGGALVMERYGHPADDHARSRLLSAYQANTGARLRVI
jgi:integrase